MTLDDKKLNPHGDASGVASSARLAPADPPTPFPFLPDTTDQGEDASNYQVHGKKFLLVERSLFCLSLSNPFRKAVLWIICSKWFENLILALIIANSFILALSDYSVVDKNNTPVPSANGRHSPNNAIVAGTETFFLACFTTECVLKILGLGFAVGKQAYLRDGWNRLDFLVVVAGLLGTVDGVPNISILRTFRVLRPLRSLTMVPGMKILVNSMLSSIPALMNVMVLFLFVFLIFGILGTKLWAGLQHARCRTTPFPVRLQAAGQFPPSAQYLANVTESPAAFRCLPSDNDNAAWTVASSPWRTAQHCFWPVDSGIHRLCSLPGNGGGFTCPTARHCGSNYDSNGNARFVDVNGLMAAATFLPQLNWGFTHFDNILAASLTIFQSITMEGWTDVMYQLQDSYSVVFTALYFLVLIMFGSFFLLNLMLAVIWDNFDKGQVSRSQEKEAEEARQLEESAGAGGDGLPLVQPRSSSPGLADAAGGAVAGGDGPGAEQQAAQAALIRPLHGLVTHPLFTAFILLLILLNSLVLALDHHPMPRQLGSDLEAINFVLSLLFAAEMVLKLLGLGPIAYVRDAFNVFDAFIVIVSVVELFLSPPAFLTPNAAAAAAASGGGAVSALRTFRLFRVFKLARSWTSLRVLLNTIGKTVADVANFAVLLALFIYIYALVGMQLFANMFHFHPTTGVAVAPGQPGYGTAVVPRAHFDDLYWSCVSIFQVLTGENWNVVMYDGWRAVGVAAPLYFVSLVIVGTFLILNLFLAILLGNFDGMGQLQEKEEAGLRDAAAGPKPTAMERLREMLLPTPRNAAATASPVRRSQIVPAPVPAPAARAAPPTDAELQRKQSQAERKGEPNRSRGEAKSRRRKNRVATAPVAIGASAAGAGEEKRPSRRSQVDAEAAAIAAADAAVARTTGAAPAAADEEAKEAPTRRRRRRSSAGAMLGGSPGGAQGVVAQTAEQTPRRRSDEDVRTSAAAAKRDSDAAAAAAAAASVVVGHPTPAAAPATLEPTVAAHPTVNVAARPMPAAAVPRAVMTPPSRRSGAQVVRPPAVEADHDDELWDDGTASAAAGGGGGGGSGARASSPRRQNSSRRGANGEYEDRATLFIAAHQCAPVRLRVDAMLAETVLQLKHHIFLRMNVPVEVQSLTLCRDSDSDGKGSDEQQLSLSDDGASLREAGITEGCTLRLQDIYGSSLWLMPPQHKLRCSVRRLVRARRFDNAILCLILLSSLLLAIENPLWDPSSPVMRAFFVLDVVMTVVFSAECLLKIAAYGFALHRGSYLRSGWNVLDFLIVLISLLSLAGSGGNASLKSLRSLRTFRALRPLRVVSRKPALKLVVNALFGSIPAIANVLFVCLLFFMIFAIFSVNYFKGTFGACQGAAFLALPPPMRSLVEKPVAWASLNASALAPLPLPPVYNATTSKAVCLALGCEWLPVVPQNFDNVLSAMGTLFEMSTTEGWVDVMYAGVDATGIDMQPVRDHNTGWALFFILYMVVGSFFVMNLFVGVVIDNFNMQKEKLGSGSLFMSEAQKQWVKTQEIMLKLKPHAKLQPPAHPVRAWCWHLVQRPGFDYCIMGCIAANTALMALSFLGQPLWLTSLFTAANYMFALVFTLEAVVKVIALDAKYFRDGWNLFDFAIVCGTDVGLVVKWTLGFNAGSFTAVFRTFRVGRILRLVRGAKSLRKLFNAFLLTLPSLGNIGGLLFLLYFIFSVMGVQLFATVKLGSYLSVHANFQGFWTGMLTLMRCSTGESWNGLMYDLSVATQCNPSPVFNPAMCGYSTAEDCVPLDGCGSPFAFVYFLSFTLLVTFVMLNLFIAVILEGFATSSENEDNQLTPAEFTLFTQVWVEFDPQATMLMTTADLFRFLQQLPAPMGFAEQPVAADMRLMHREVAQLHLPIYGEGQNQVHFHDVAHALSLRIHELHAAARGEALETLADDHRINKEWAKRFRASALPVQSAYSVESYYAALSIQRGFRAFRFRKSIGERANVHRRQEAQFARHSPLGNTESDDEAAPPGVTASPADLA